MSLFKTKQDETLFINDTVIEHGMVLDAAMLSGSCGLLVRGIVKSSIDIDADVVVDSSGSVDGDITCRHCTVMGSVCGNIAAAGQLIISEDGSVLGDITCQTLQIHHGGNFRGNCNKIKKPGKPGLYNIFALQDNLHTYNEEECLIGSIEAASFRDACYNLSLVDETFKEGFDLQTMTFRGHPLVESLH